MSSLLAAGREGGHDVVRSADLHTIHCHCRLAPGREGPNFENIELRNNDGDDIQMLKLLSSSSPAVKPRKNSHEWYVGAKGCRQVDGKARDSGPGVVADSFALP